MREKLLEQERTMEGSINREDMTVEALNSELLAEFAADFAADRIARRQMRKLDLNAALRSL